MIIACMSGVVANNSQKKRILNSILPYVYVSGFHAESIILRHSLISLRNTPLGPFASGFSKTQHRQTTIPGTNPIHNGSYHLSETLGLWIGSS